MKSDEEELILDNEEFVEFEKELKRVSKKATTSTESDQHLIIDLMRFDWESPAIPNVEN